jgi:hypothetical protein
MTLQTKETYNEDKSEVKLGLKLTVWWHRLCAAIYGLFAIIVVGLLALKIISSGDITAGSLLALVALLIAVLAWLFWKVADLLSVYATNGWWWAMMLNMIGTFSMNPICLIIVIYLWLNRKMFGVGTE